MTIDTKLGRELLAGRWAVYPWWSVRTTETDSYIAYGPEAEHLPLASGVPHDIAERIVWLHNHGEELLAAAEQLTAAQARVAELESLNRAAGEFAAALIDKALEDAAAEKRRADETEAKLRGLEAEARADKALIKRITRVCDECPEEGHCERCDGAGVVPVDPQAEAELQACIDGFPDDIDGSQMPHQMLAELVGQRDAANEMRARAEQTCATTLARMREEKAELRKRAENAEAKAVQYERDWYDAKSEFGEATSKLRAAVREAEREREEMREALDRIASTSVDVST